MNDEYDAGKQRGDKVLRAFWKKMNDEYDADKDKI